ncbi:hypothetical protein P43SY_008492 [Pythium insidiosum]|uniref:EF-hand domain-containing protein n=1 Tax=Pythium insidiosum TaxID=114742 RepID=A0AAD5LQG1_PYTIN|nr:hypothetical protein P43SY_008492 [Pythium insidiosum]
MATPLLRPRLHDGGLAGPRDSRTSSQLAASASAAMQPPVTPSSPAKRSQFPSMPSIASPPSTPRAAAISPPATSAKPFRRKLFASATPSNVPRRPQQPPTELSLDKRVILSRLVIEAPPPLAAAGTDNNQELSHRESTQNEPTDAEIAALQQVDAQLGAPREMERWIDGYETDKSRFSSFALLTEMKLDEIQDRYVSLAGRPNAVEAAACCATLLKMPGIVGCYRSLLEKIACGIESVVYVPLSSPTSSSWAVDDNGSMAMLVRRFYMRTTYFQRVTQLELQLREAKSLTDPFVLRSLTHGDIVGLLQGIPFQKLGVAIVDAFAGQLPDMDQLMGMLHERRIEIQNEFYRQHGARRLVAKRLRRSSQQNGSTRKLEGGGSDDNDDDDDYPLEIPLTSSAQICRAITQHAGTFSSSGKEMVLCSILEFIDVESFKDVFKRFDAHGKTCFLHHLSVYESSEHLQMIVDHLPTPGETLFRFYYVICGTTGVSSSQPSDRKGSMGPASAKRVFFQKLLSPEMEFFFLSDLASYLSEEQWRQLSQEYEKHAQERKRRKHRVRQSLNEDEDDAEEDEKDDEDIDADDVEFVEDDIVPEVISTRVVRQPLTLNALLGRQPNAPVMKKKEKYQKLASTVVPRSISGLITSWRMNTDQLIQFAKKTMPTVLKLIADAYGEMLTAGRRKANYQQLTQMSATSATSALIASSSGPGNTHLLNVFRAGDVNGDGQLTSAEFTHIVLAIDHTRELGDILLMYSDTLRRTECESINADIFLQVAKDYELDRAAWNQEGELRNIVNDVGELEQTWRETAPLMVQREGVNRHAEIAPVAVPPSVFLQEAGLMTPAQRRERLDFETKYHHARRAMEQAERDERRLHQIVRARHSTNDVLNTALESSNDKGHHEPRGEPFKPDLLSHPRNATSQTLPREYQKKADHATPKLNTHERIFTDTPLPWRVERAQHLRNEGHAGRPFDIVNGGVVSYFPPTISEKQHHRQGHPSVIVHPYTR